MEKDDYYTVKAQASLVRQVTKNTSVQLGVFKEVLGKNSGNGLGATVSLWYSF
jgi:ribosomal protein S19E (S16A)